MCAPDAVQGKRSAAMHRRSGAAQARALSCKFLGKVTPFRIEFIDKL